jgi:poly(A) polymerase
MPPELPGPSPTVPAGPPAGEAGRHGGQVNAQGLVARALSSLEADPSIALLRELASDRPERAYVVGGFLRDLALGFSPPDVDFALRDARDVAARFARATRGSFVLLHDDEQGDRRLVQARVVVRGTGGAPAAYDFGELSPEGIDADLAARDFTINALALPLRQAADAEPPDLIDPFGGLRDLAAGVVRLVSPDAIARDPLRILRAFRFAATLQFEIDPETLAHLASNADKVGAPAAERTRAELLRLMSALRSVGALRMMDAAGVLTILLPELEAGRGTGQSGFHDLDVFEHGIATYAAAEDVLADLPAWFGELAPEAEAYLAQPDRIALLKLAALLHDIAKPATRSEQPGGIVHFYEHDRIGAAMCGAIARRLRLSRRQTTMLSTLVRHHMRMLHLAHAEDHACRQAGQGDVTARAARRLRKHCGVHGVGVLLLGFADALATRGPDMPADAPDQLRRIASRLLSLWHEDDRRAKTSARLLTGHDIMAEFGVSEGPQLGRALDLVAEAQLEGVVSTREEALAFLQSNRRRWRNEH